MLKNQFLKFLIALLALNSLNTLLHAQERIMIHSHNDYRQRVPFYQAYAQQVYSIEVDVFAGKQVGSLLVGHDKIDLIGASTFDELYLQPILMLYKQNAGRAWKESDDKLQLMVELKSATEPALSYLVDKLNSYPEIFDSSHNPFAVNVVITGNVPKVTDFEKYPSFISFDGNVDTDYTAEQLKRISLISAPFHKYARWNGKGALKANEQKSVQAVIDQAHALGKPFRFWAIPNSVTAWNTLHRMGVDIINTDKVEACTEFFRNFEDKNYRIDEQKSASEGVIKTDRLDKTTAGFQGFDRKKLQLTKRVETYTPHYLNDGASTPIKNVIFLIGDGMGLAQIHVAATANGGLTLLQLKHLGLQECSSKDQHNTDSAAGGSALATGKPTCNRHISMSETGEAHPSLTDYAYDKGMACGVVTLGNIADATPAAFYGHTTERDHSEEITNYLLDGKLILLNGSGMNELTGRKDAPDFMEKLKAKYRIATAIDDINTQDDKVICVDEQMGIAAEEESIDLLAKATREAIRKLSTASEKGFFLMVEGAKIDYAGHANSLAGTIVEMLSFDLAIQEALKFADTNGETLVVITADHETGGLTLVDGDNKGLITARFMTDDHTPIMIPVFAYGPGAQQFSGVYKNTEIFHQIKKALNL